MAAELTFGRNFGFREHKEGVKYAMIYNANSTRALDEGELVYANGFFGEVRNSSRNQDGGIPAGEWGIINIDLERIIETRQFKTGEVFARADSAAIVNVYFQVQTNAAVGRLIDGVTTAPATGNVLVGVLEEAKGTAPAVRFRPLPLPLAVTA